MSVWAHIRRAELTIGREFGVGGESWSILRPVGDGQSAPVTLIAVGTWAGYVVKDSRERPAPAAPLVDVGAAPWHAVGLIAGPQVGDVLVSAADPLLAFAVKGADRVAGYARYLVDPAAVAPAGALLLETGYALLTEAGDRLVLEA